MIQESTSFGPSLTNPLANIFDIRKSCANCNEPHLGPELHPDNDHFEHSTATLIQEMDFVNLNVRLAMK